MPLSIVTSDSDRVGKLAYATLAGPSLPSPTARPSKRSRLTRAQQYLRELATNRTVLDPNVSAPEDAIAFFSSETGHFGDRCIRIDPDSFEEYGITEPAWAQPARYRIAFRGERLWTNPKKFTAGLSEAVRYAVVLCNRRERKRLSHVPLAIISPARAELYGAPLWPHFE